jgi:hypothetical protein
MKKKISTSVLGKLKSIVAKTKKRFFGASKNNIKDEYITFSQAVDIQKEAFLKSNKTIKKSYTPPYLELEAQLLANEYQVFQAAANHLVLIAKKRPKYKNQIKSVFAELLANPKLSQQKNDYLSEKLEEIQA